jgi:hypothetical protein
MHPGTIQKVSKKVPEKKRKKNSETSSISLSLNVPARSANSAKTASGANRTTAFQNFRLARRIASRTLRSAAFSGTCWRATP